MHWLLKSNVTSQNAVKYIVQVRDTVPPGQLLVFDVKEGWTPLCQFLQVPVPDVPFPNINDANEIRFSFSSSNFLASRADLHLHKGLSD